MSLLKPEKMLKPEHDEASILKREDILAASDLVIELVSVPEWGGDVYVKGMTGAERDKFEGSIFRASVGKKAGKVSEVDRLNLSNVRAKLCSMTICDEDGKRLFTEKDVQALSQKSAAALQRVFVVAQRLSGITDEDIEELAEELEDNPFDDSASD